MTINIFVLKGELNGKNRSGAFLFLSRIYLNCSQKISLIISHILLTSDSFNYLVILL